MSTTSNPERWQRGRMYHVLLAFLFLLLLTQPLANVGGGVVVRLVFAALLISSITAVASRPAFFAIGLGLGVPAVILLFVPGRFPVGLAALLSIATLLFICLVLLSRVFSRPGVTSATISASLAVYLALGVVWAQAYRLVEHLQPGSFTNLSGASLPNQRDLFYYSYVTLTTLGYGDISPLSPEARALAITEAIVGQLYLVVLVAGLVGMHFSSKQAHTDRSISLERPNATEVP